MDLFFGMILAGFLGGVIENVWAEPPVRHILEYSPRV